MPVNFSKRLTPLLALALVAACVREGAADRSPPKDAKPAAPAKEPPMSDQPIHQAPPPIAKPPAQDTGRYVAWLAKRGTPLKDTAREDVAMRLGDWGFFDHGGAPGEAIDRAAIDRAEHAVFASEKAAWFALLSTKNLSAADAHKRIAWLFRAIAFEPNPKVPKVAPPTLTTAPDGTITFQGWLAHPPQVGRPVRLTITATAKATKFEQLSHDSL